MKPTDAWFGAVLDVCGQVKIRKTRERPYPYLDVGGPLAALFAERFGGQAGRWTKSGHQAMRVIELLRPHMVVRASLLDQILTWKPGPVKRPGRRPTKGTLGGDLYGLCRDSTLAEAK